MKQATRTWIDYTNERKIDIEEAKKREASAVPIKLYEVRDRPMFSVPRISSNIAKVQYGSIQYSKPLSELQKVKKLLGNTSMSNYKAGEKTFEYFLANESEE